MLPMQYLYPLPGLGHGCRVRRLPQEGSMMHSLILGSYKNLENARQPQATLWLVFQAPAMCSCPILQLQYLAGKLWKLIRIILPAED